MKNNTLLFILLIILNLGAAELLSQERLGLRLDNFQGIHSVFLNPANSATQSLNWNFNIVGAGVFGETNYAFIENSSLFDVAQKSILNRDEIGLEATPDLDEYVVADFNNQDSRKFVDVDGFVTGPSFLAHLDNHNFGVFLNYRFQLAEQNLDEDFGYYTNQRIPLTDSVELERTKISSMLWREIGGHYAYSVETNFGKIVFGTNIKYLGGIEALTLETTRPTELKRISEEEVSAETADIVLMATTPALDQSDDFGKSVKGNGVGIDFGVTVQFEDYVDDYKLKIGAAIRDIGSIQFNRDTEAHIFNASGSTIFDKQNYLELSGVRDIVNRVSTDVLGDPDASLDPSVQNFKVGLPTSLVINADLKIANGLYLGGVFVQRFPKANIGLEKSNVLALAPRYESKWVGVTVPVSMVNYANPRVGAALRLAFLTVGSENIGAFTSKKELNGGDFYLSLQFFGLNENGFFNRIFRSRGKKTVKCYEM